MTTKVKAPVATPEANALLRALQNVVFKGQVQRLKQRTAEIEAVKAAAADPYAKSKLLGAFRVAYICGRKSWKLDKAGLASAIALLGLPDAQRTPEDQAMIKAMRVYVSDRVKAAGVEAESTSGRKRGAKTPQKAAQAPSEAVAGVSTAQAKAKAQAGVHEAVTGARGNVLTPTTVVPPRVGNAAEGMNHMAGLAAYLRTFANANAGTLTEMQRDRIARAAALLMETDH